MQGSFLGPQVLLKGNPQVQNSVSCAKAHDTNLDLKPDLIAVSTSPGNIILINKYGIFWPSTSHVICHMSPVYHPHQGKKKAVSMMKTFSFTSPKKRCPGPKPMFFLLLAGPLLHRSSCKHIPLCVAPQTGLLLAT